MVVVNGKQAALHSSIHFGMLSAKAEQQNKAYGRSKKPENSWAEHKAANNIKIT